MSDDQVRLKKLMLDVAKLKKDAEEMMALADKIERGARWILLGGDEKAIAYTDNAMLYFINNSDDISSDLYGSISIDDLTQIFNSFYKGEDWSKKMVRTEISKLGFDSVRVGTKRGIKGLVRKNLHADQVRH
jgi:hypothetical protein